MLLKKFTDNQILQLKEIHKSSFFDGDFYIDYFIKHRLPTCTCFVEIEDGITGVLYAKPITIQIGDKLTNIPFVTGLATHPNWRKRGIASRLLEECISYSTFREAPFVMLYPFNHDFYRRQGFITVSHSYSEYLTDNQIQASSIAKLWDNISLSPIQLENDKYTISELNISHYTLCKDIYENIMQSFKGFHVRDLLYYKDLFEEHFGDGAKGALISYFGEPISYILFYKEEVREIVSPPLHSHSISKIFNDIGITLQFPYSLKNTIKGAESIEFKHESVMARACNVEELLMLSQLNPSINGNILFKVKNDCYETTAISGKISSTVKKTSLCESASLSSQYENVFIFDDVASLLKTVIGNDSTNPLYLNKFIMYNIIIYDKF